MKIFKNIIITFFLLSLVGCYQEIENDNTPQGTIEALWQLIDTRYCFVEEKQIDWDGVLPIFLEKSKEVQDIYSLFDLCAQMLDTLQDGHVNIYTPFEHYSCKKWYENYPKNFDWDVITEKYLADYKYNGSMYYGLLNDSIGYIYYGSFNNFFSESNIYYVLSYLSGCKGLILDVRNNGGGSLSNADRLASIFITEPISVGFLQHKTGKKHDDFSDWEPIKIKKEIKSTWKRPVVVLMNRHSYSATNYFINACRYINNIVLFGGISGGGGGIPLSYDLPNGWLVRFSSVKMVDREKKSIEQGILPNIEVNNEDNSNSDFILESAIKYIKIL